MDSFKISSFQSGINEYYSEGLIKPYEAVSAYNCNTLEGSLKTFNAPAIEHTIKGNISSLMAYYGVSDKQLLVTVGNELLKTDDSKIYDLVNANTDYLNFEKSGNRVMIGVSKDDSPFMYDGATARKLKNRRPTYDKEGGLSGYIDASGNKHTTEDTITTFAPSGEFLELHYDRLWVAGNKDNPDRIYFSTAGVNGADIEDFTVPLAEEDEINMHGGFIDVRSYDGSKIIGMKTIFNSIVIFKEKSAYKVYGSSPSNYQMIQLFSCSGAIADKSIVTGNNGAYFLSRDGIYFYDGTNINLVSQKIKSTISKMNLNYASKAVGIYIHNKYYLAIPTGNSTDNNTLIVLDTINNSYMIYNVGNISSFIEYDNKILFSSGNKIYNLVNSTGTPMNLYWESPNIDFGKKNSRKLSEYIYFRAKGNGKLRFTLRTERNTKSIEIPLTNQETLYRKKLKNKGRMFKIIIENVNNSSFELISPEVICEIDED